MRTNPPTLLHTSCSVPLWSNAKRSVPTLIDGGGGCDVTKNAGAAVEFSGVLVSTRGEGVALIWFYVFHTFHIIHFHSRPGPSLYSVCFSHTLVNYAIISISTDLMPARTFYPPSVRHHTTHTSHHITSHHITSHSQRNVEALE